MAQSHCLSAPLFLHSYSDYHHAEVAEGWLSLKSMWQGEADYWLENGRLTVTPHTYLILNDQQPYTIHIEGETAIESFCIFFSAMGGRCPKKFHNSRRWAIG